MAVEAGCHLALVSKEVDVVVGPGLSALARQRNRVVTPIDGDQPSLLIGLVTWAETLGFTIVAAGKSSEYDFVFDEGAGTLASNNQVSQVQDLAQSWSMNGRPAEEVVRQRAQIASSFQQRTVPDLCELLIAANAINLVPDRPDLHAPILRISEVPDVFSPRSEGGLLEGDRRVDVFNCLRRPMKSVSRAACRGGALRGPGRMGDLAAEGTRPQPQWCDGIAVHPASRTRARSRDQHLIGRYSWRFDGRRGSSAALRPRRAGRCGPSRRHHAHGNRSSP